MLFASVTINQGAGAIGDALMGLGVVNELRIITKAKIVYKVGRRALPFIKCFDGYDELKLHDWDHYGTRPLKHSKTVLQLNDGYFDEINTRGAITRIQRYCNNAGVEKWRFPSLKTNLPHSLYEGAVVIAPFCDSAEREYPLALWLELEKLLTKRWNVVVTDNRPYKCRHFTCKKVVGTPAANVVSLVRGAALVIANDSGVSHLAGVLGVPTLALCGQVRGERIYNCYSSVIPINATWDCAGCYWAGRYRKGPWKASTCLPRCPALSSISPQYIFTLAEQIGSKHF